MTIQSSEIVHSVATAPDVASTHAIVIGIGEYPFASELGAPGLKSPPHSAKAMADWLITDFDNPARPLASVALLVSAERPFTYSNPLTGETFEVPCGTTEELERAVCSWARRAAGNPDNGCVFYFCGHGIRSGQVDCILSRSYGKDEMNHLKDVFDRTGLVTAMRFTGPKHQIFLFDTCRKDDYTSSITPGHLRNFFSPRYDMVRPVDVEQSRLFAAAEGAKAYGNEDGPSVFVNEFLKACTSAAEKAGEWWVSTGLVQRHLQNFVEGQRCQMEGVSMRLTRLKGEPLIPVVVCCDPRHDINRVVLGCHDPAGVSLSFDGSAQLDAVEWRLTLNHDSYRFTASSSSDDFLPFQNDRIMVFPPFCTILVDIRQGKLG